MAFDNDVVITGLGPVTPIGVGADSLWASLRDGTSGARKRQLVVDAGVTVDAPVASMPVPDALEGIAPHIEFLGNHECGAYRDLAYALWSVELALRDAGIDLDRDNNNIGAIQAFEAPGVEQTVNHLLGMLSAPPQGGGPPRVYDALAPSFYNAQPFLYVHLVAKAFGLHGYSTSVHNACPTGAFAIDIAAQRIRSGQADVMLVLGAEAFDTAVRLEWFRRLDLYARECVMRPFDRDATGFFVGEGAGAIVLESAERARARGASVYASLRGGAFAQQAWKQTIPDMTALRLRDVIGAALKDAELQPGDLDLVVPHGAAVRVSDGYESICLDEALGGQSSDAVATAFKPHIGHLLAGSVVIETICMLLAMKHGCVPATLHTRAEDSELPLPLMTSTGPRTIRAAMKMATGFTGHDAAMVFIAD